MSKQWKWVKRLATFGAVSGGTGLLVLLGYPKYHEVTRTKRAHIEHVLAANKQRDEVAFKLPSREEQLKRLSTEEFDVLIIGGGATGAGCALDAVTRGLKVAMVEKFDFGAGTSSRSTKLIHGGVRYLQKAFAKLDYDQYRMVKEALSERANLLQIAPHLSSALPIMLPVYKWWQLPYYWVGIKAYDFVAGKEVLKTSYYLSKSKALELFPMLKKHKLVGAIVYYDGQHNDARMNLSIALASARRGATTCNHTLVLSLIHDSEGKVSGARVLDRMGGKEYEVKAKCVINATGPYTDFIRKMDNPEIKTICQPSSGVHIVLPDYYSAQSRSSPSHMGLLDPATSDGRVIFFLPWEKSTMAGTTDNPAIITDNPEPKETEIQFILNEIRNYLSPDVQVRRGDVLSAWSGIRPLVSDPNKSNTESLARNHIIEVSPSKLITIAGGKWTTYREMAEETISRSIQECNLEPRSGCRTKGLLLEGSHDWSPTMFIRLVQDYGLESEVAVHLANTYGDKAFQVAKLANLTGKRWPISGRRLHDEYPYLEAEVLYACQEYAATAIDILARRTRLAFLNVQAAEEALPKIIQIMSEELNWSKDRIEYERVRALRFLRKEMGLDLRTQSQNVPINFTKEEINSYVERFKMLDTDSKGYITVNDLRKYFKKIGETVTEDQIHDILNEVDLNRNGQIDLGEFLQMMSALKIGAAGSSRFGYISKSIDDQLTVNVDRSGGGV